MWNGIILSDEHTLTLIHGWILDSTCFCGEVKFLQFNVKKKICDKSYFKKTFSI